MPCVLTRHKAGVRTQVEAGVSHTATIQFHYMKEIFNAHITVAGTSHAIKYQQTATEPSFGY